MSTRVGVSILSRMWRRKTESTLDDVVEVLEGLGQMLQVIDRRLEVIAGILRGDDEEE